MVLMSTLSTITSSSYPRPRSSLVLVIDPLFLPLSASSLKIYSALISLGHQTEHTDHSHHRHDQRGRGWRLFGG